MARTIRTKVFKFDELSEEAQEKAISDWRDKGYDNSHYYDEITDSVKAMVELFGLKTGRQYSDLRHSHIDDDILNLSGVRLYKYLMNKYYTDLFKPKYIKSVDRELRCRQFVCKVHKNHKGEPFTQIYSKNFRDNTCVLTGVCYDMDILDPVHNFLKKPDGSTWEDLISEMESAISKTYRETEEWLSSDEFLRDEIKANDIEFTKDGKQFNS